MNNFSKMNNFNKMNNFSKMNNNSSYSTIKGYLAIVVFICLFAGGMVFLSGLMSNKKTTNVDAWNPYVEDIEKIERTSNRGTIISMCLIAGAGIQAIMKSCGAASTMLLLLYGFFMNAVMGFLGDQGFGKDDGFSLKFIVRNALNKDNKKEYGFSDVTGTTIKYLLGCLTSAEFWRFIITVFLDMFISMPIQMIIVAYSEKSINKFKNTIPNMLPGFSHILKMLINNYDNLLQSFVGFITFLAYTNDTRFRWAYPGNDVDPSLLISTGTIKLATAIAAVVYLITNVVADFNIINGIEQKVGSALGDTLPKKLLFVLLIICIMTGGSMNQSPVVPSKGLKSDPIMFFVNTLMSFMNYEPSKYSIGPLENYKLTEFWNLNKINTNNSTECKPDGIDLCYQNPSKFSDIELQQQKTGDTILFNNIKKRGGVENEAPCLIATRKIGEKCLVPQNGDKNTFKQHKHFDKLAMPINMAAYMKPSRTVVTKYDLINNYKLGFVIFFFYCIMGFIVPFVPLKAIYGDEYEDKSRLYKLIIMIVVVGAFLGAINPFFGFGKNSPDVASLKASEKELLENMK